MERKHRSLTVTITRYYLTFFLMILVSVIAAAFVSRVAVQFVVSNFRTNVNAAQLVRPDYENIDIRGIAKLGGWVEIIRDNRVVEVLGTKQDKQYIYSDSDLGQEGFFRLRQTNSFYDDKYFYSTAYFIDYDYNENLCLVKIPRRNIESGIRGFFSSLDQQTHIERILIFALVCTVVSFTLFFLLCVMIYSRITTRKITKPLEAIGHGIAGITAGDLSTRMDFEAEKEFADIRDALNYMAGRLQTAEQEKREMEENRKKMVMGISHDLKTPITTVYGYAKALGDGVVTEPERRQRHLQYIQDKAVTMSKLIDDLFKYSTLEGSEYRLNLETEDFAEFLRKLIAESYLDIENKGILLELDIPETPVPYRFDTAEMHRAITNILGNAVKYNPPGTALSVALQQGAEGLLLTIADTGVGISQELRETVFDEFVRGDAARTNDGGSGLGLAIARRVIEMHGGRIALRSEPGKGTTFTIRLPGQGA